ncbi:MAG: diguanylate cyclase [Alphaproteobacteria bacterium]|nr:diguanylate cyclase [Alphaproteobacteria bacterium]
MDEATRVLLVEDEPGDARLVMALLKQARFDRFEISVAIRLQEALERTRDLSFDAVLLDLSLPDSHGMETIRVFRREAPDLPIIVLTGLADREVGLQAMKEGCQDYLVKGHGDGETIARAVLHSIQRKRLESDLFRAKEEYRSLVDALPDAILLCTRNELLPVNEAARLLCRDVSHLRGREFPSLVASRDAAKVGTLIGEVLGGARRSGVVEARVRSCEGGLTEAEIVVLAVGHDSGPAAEVIVHDLTARREADHFRTLASTVFEGSAEAMIVTDASTRIRMVNAAFTEITGYRPEDVIGLTPHVLSSGKHSQEFYKEMWRTLLTSGHWRGDIWNRRKNGEVYVQRLTISAIRGYGGTVENFVGVFSDVTEQRQREDVARHRAFHDVLTGLPNRALLQDRLEQALTQARRRRGGLAVLFLDLDGFKPVNDQYGHQVGDELLRRVAERLRDHVRETDTVARIGGDEFVILLTNVTDRFSVDRAAGSILRALAQPVPVGDITVTVGVSIGIATFPEAGSDPAELIANADKAMYLAKRYGKGAYCHFPVEDDDVA